MKKTTETTKRNAAKTFHTQPPIQLKINKYNFNLRWSNFYTNSEYLWRCFGCNCRVLIEIPFNANRDNKL